MKTLCLSAFSIFLCLFISTSYGQEPQLTAKQRTLTAVIPIDSPPTYYKDNKTGEAAGFAVDVMNAIGKQSGYSINYQFKKDWQEIIDAVKNGTADVAPGMGITEERIKVLSFTSSMEVFPVSVFVRAGSNIAGLRNDLRVGVIKGSAAAEIINKQHPKIRLVTLDSFQGGLLDLLAGQIDVFCCPAPTLLALARNADLENHIKIVGAPLLELKRAIAMRKGDSQLLAELNKSIADFVDTPQYKQLYTQWYGSPQPYWTVQRILIFSAAVVLFIVIIMAVWRHYSILILNKNLAIAKEQLRQSEYFSRTVIEAEPECVKIIDVDGNLIFMNGAGLKMIEATSLEQVKGQCVCPLVGAENRDAFMKFIRDVCKGGSGSLVFEMVGLKGRHLWLETHAVPYRNEIDKTTVLLGITRDITEKRKAEAALKQSEENFRMLFNKSADAIFLVRPDGSIADINDMACQRYKYSREELLKMNVSQIDSPATSKSAPERTAKVVEKRFVVFAAEHISKDGEIIPVEANASATLLNGEPILISTCRDITERKKAEEALLDEKERLAVTLRSIGDGVIVTDISGNITLLNKVSEHLTGWSNEEAKGKPLTEVFNIINETTRVKCENPVEKVLKTGIVVGLANHTALIKKDGTEIIIADSAAPIRDRQSKTIGIVLVFRDITAQYRMEQEMQKLEKVETLGLLAGGLAHDFNNLLTSVMGNVSLVKMQVGTEHKSFARLTEVERATRRAADLTQQLLTFAKGGAPIKKIASISEIAKESCNFALSGSNVRCLYNVPNSLWSAEVDRGQMNQVFNNLIINAVQAMPHGGSIRISFENATVKESEVPSLKAGDYIKVKIKDEGVGIPKEVISKIFEPYFTTKQNGNGLGLPTVLSIVKRHEGQVLVDSIEGKGTTFALYVPACNDTFCSEQEETMGIQAGHGRILVMDDEPLVRDVSTAILTELGYEVSEAIDGKEAIEIYSMAEKDGKPFSAVIMDLTIPGGMGGKEAVRKLLEIAPNAKVIVSSGYSTDPIMADYKKYGFCGVVVKPYNTNEVSEVIAKVLGG